MNKYKRQRHDQRQQSNWPLRAFIIIFGALWMTLGAVGLHNGVGWIPKFDQRTGAVGFTSPLNYFIFGVIMVSIGAVPWNSRFERRTKRKP
jgi:hypothetical protein